MIFLRTTLLSLSLIALCGQTLIAMPLAKQLTDVLRGTLKQHVTELKQCAQYHPPIVHTLQNLEQEIAYEYQTYQGAVAIAQTSPKGLDEITRILWQHKLLNKLISLYHPEKMQHRFLAMSGGFAPAPVRQYWRHEVSRVYEETGVLFRTYKHLFRADYYNQCPRVEIIEFRDYMNQFDQVVVVDEASDWIDKFSSNSEH